MRAALIESYGQFPVVAEIDAPGGESATVVAAGLNPVDRLIATGDYLAFQPKPPYTPGMEGVARTAHGELVYFGRPADIRHGAMAEQALLDPAECFPLPPGIDPGQAIACGIAGLAAWIGVRVRGALKPGERVAITGATGVSGRIAVQAAKLLGASHVLAIGRSAEHLVALEPWADETAVFDDPSFVSQHRISQGEPYDLAIDFTWGSPAQAVLRSLAVGGRLVQIGSAAQAGLGLAGADLRRGQWSILGFSIFNVPVDERRQQYADLLSHVSAGRIEVATSEIGLGELPAAWEAQAAGSPHAKTIVRLG